LRKGQNQKKGVLFSNGEALLPSPLWPKLFLSLFFKRKKEERNAQLDL
jgi:hypothetical protein